MDVLSKTLYFLLSAPFIFLLVRFRLLHSAPVRTAVLLLHAAVLTVLTVFLFNQPSWSWSNQTALIQDVAGRGSHPEAYQYIRDRFILVDNSADKELVPNPEGDEDDSTTVAVTDRRKLTAFLQLLGEHKDLVDLVVADIDFRPHKTTGLVTATDSLLQGELLTLSADNKLLLSVVPEKQSPQDLGLQANVYGNVSEEGSGKLFVSHTVYQNGYFSLPYKLYAHLNGLTTDEPYLRGSLLKETDTAGEVRHTVSNTFFPEFYITDEAVLQGKAGGPGHSVTLDIDSGYESADHSFYFLSEPLSAPGRREFAANLAQRRQRGQKNIIFLGTFASPTEDIHQTIYTDLHGPVILLNVLYALQLKRHYLTWPYVLILFIGYSLISWVLIHNLVRLHLLSAGQKAVLKKRLPFLAKGVHQLRSGWGRTAARARKYKAIQLAANIVDFLVEFVLIEMLHLVLLLALIFVVKQTTGHLVNGMSLLVYLTIVNALLKFARRYLASPQGAVHQPS